MPDGEDNCPSVANPGQENFDGDGPPFGNGAGIGNGVSLPGDDGTVANADGIGDACDDDDDNDGIPDVSDGDPRGDSTYDDNGDGVMLGAGDDGPSWDADGNAVVDGQEAVCPLTLNPGGDDDADGLLNTWETCKWGTGPTVLDGDGDSLGDCVEVADVNGDGIVNFVGDALAYAKAALAAPDTFGRDGDFDMNGDGVINFVGDVVNQAKLALVDGLCQ